MSKVCPKIINAVICYANEEEVIQYARELRKQSAWEDLFLVVTVNKEGDFGLRYLKEELSEVGIGYDVIKAEDNMGYLNGLLAGYHAIKERFSDVAWYVFSNTDIQIADRLFFEKFFNKSTFYDGQIWAVGPSVYATASGKYMNPYIIHRPSKLYYYKLLVCFLFPHMVEALYAIKNKITKKKSLENSSESGYVYTIHGSYMILKKELLEELGKRDKWEVLYDEEPYVAEVARQFDKKVYYDGSLEVKHVEGTSTGKVNLKKRYSLMAKATKRILKEFYCNQNGLD